MGRHALRFLAGLPGGPRQVLALDRTVPLEPPSGTAWATCELADRRKVAAILAEFRPDAVLHLAAVLGGDDLAACFSANVQVAEILLSEAARLPEMPRILFVGSAAQYGSTGPGTVVVGEEHPLRGETPYGLSKTLQERWALLYWTARRLPVICTRPFNLIGPGQATTLVPGAFLVQVRQVLQGRIPHVQVGNLSSHRDFVDVRDLVRAFWSLLASGPQAFGQVFNIASGVATSIQDLLDACVELGGGRIPVRQSEDRMKAVDVSTMIGDAARLHALTGWRSEIPWRQSLAEMWAHLQSQETGRAG